MKTFETTTGKLAVISPYHPSFVSGARKLNGKWNTGQWEFDMRDKGRVHSLMLRVYGTNGEDNPELTDVTVVLDAHAPNPFFAYGKEIASRPSRDARVRLGDGVVVLEGDFPRSCGSAKYPGILNNGTVTVEVRDVPARLVKWEAEND